MNSYEASLFIKDVLKQNGWGGSTVEREECRVWDDEYLITIQLGDWQSFQIRVHETIPERYLEKREKANAD